MVFIQFSKDRIMRIQINSYEPSPQLSKNSQYKRRGEADLCAYAVADPAFRRDLRPHACV